MLGKGREQVYNSLSAFVDNMWTQKDHIHTFGIIHDHTYTYTA
jgi:hypothetical protein